MHSNGPISKIGGSGRSTSVLAGRRGSLMVAALAAALACVLIYLFVTHYRQNTTTPVISPTASSVSVLVAKQYIPAGTPFTQIASEGLLQHRTVPIGQVLPGAIVDPSAVSGETTKRAIAADGQVTAQDFSTTAKPLLSSSLSGDYRAVAFSLDGAHGLTSYLHAGQRVDVMDESGQTSELLVQDVEVLANASGTVILRLTDKQALLVTAATGDGALWLSLRPDHGASESIGVGDEEKL